MLHHKGSEYTIENIDQLLHNRHFSAMQRKNGQRTKGPKPFTKENRQQFKDYFDAFLQQLLDQN